MEPILKSVRLARKLVEDREQFPIVISLSFSTPLGQNLESLASVKGHGETELLPEPNLSLSLACADPFIMNLIEDEMANGQDCSLVVQVNGIYKEKRVTAVLEDVWVLGLDREMGLLNIIVGGLEEKAEPNNEIVQLNEQRDPSLARFSDLWED